MPSFVKKAPPTAPQDIDRVHDTVRRILADIRQNGDAAVRRYAREFDRWEDETFRVDDDTIRKAERQLPKTFKDDFAFCHRQIVEFAKRQLDSISSFDTEVEPGIRLGQKIIPIDAVGCYVPGGKYPLVSSAIMSVGTARAAGVNRIVACSPPRNADGIYPPTLYALHASGADEIYALGGIQAFASLAYGRVGIQAVDLVTGAGNAFVAEAKRQLFGTVGIDLLAGPTEIAIIADDSADPELVATDLLGQAEHGPDSPAWLITTSRSLGEAVLAAVDRQLVTLPTREIAAVSWRDHGEIVVVADDDEAIALSDAYAPEHLEVMTRRNAYYLDRLRNYGSLFLGEESTVAYGDKGVGTNHTLPTAGAARYTGGLWVGKFVKTVTWQQLTPEASRRIAPIMARVCAIEGMQAHKITADVRLERYTDPTTAPSVAV
ncbi:MAG: histidinol dehydrogenase [Burkholderiales bacterium]|nr:histidinol dehydrogenase [Burkholderiales bacterium]